MPPQPSPKRGWPEETVSEFIDQLSSAGEDYRRLVERLPAIIYTAELGEHGRWRYVSPQVEEILGYSPEEWTANPELWAKLLHPEDRHLLARARATRSETMFQARLRHKAGDYIWVEVLLRPVLSHDGDRPVAITAAIRAISRNRDLAAA